MIDFECKACLAAESDSEQPSEVLKIKEISDPTKAYVIGHKRGSLWAFAELENWRESILQYNEEIKAELARKTELVEVYERVLNQIELDQNQDIDPIDKLKTMHYAVDPIAKMRSMRPSVNQPRWRVYIGPTPIYAWLSLGNASQFTMGAFWTPSGRLFLALENIGAYTFGFDVHANYVRDKLDISISDSRNLADWINAQFAKPFDEQGEYEPRFCRENDQDFFSDEG